MTSDDLSPAALAICRAYWRRGPDRRPAPTCCVGCPIAAECSAPCGPGADGLVRYVESVNAAAARADSQRQLAVDVAPPDAEPRGFVGPRGREKQ